ncbi:diguanylate cyclase [Tissierella sp.]|uniref:GGDEF domain-containing protein n=1 Tax=Tissierella sp. TaxID=41274 RepID=UPI0028A61B08|nr:diguanylate cyclase [Tissierella sp.]
MGKKITRNNKKTDIKSVRLEKELILDLGTGIFNKKQGFIKLKRQIERCNIEKKSISIAFIDVDKLENINDKFEHREGDRLINGIATIIKKNIRKEDFVYRYGGG